LVRQRQPLRMATADGIAAGPFQSRADGWHLLATFGISAGSTGRC
jgi:hypothetical protein